MTSLKFVKREFFNPTIMKSLLIHQGLDYDTKQQLKKYHKKRVNGNCVETVYDYAKEYQVGKLGRIYAAANVGLQSFPRDVRNALAQDLYFDVDMVNAHPTILYKICKENGWVCDYLGQYVNHREHVMNHIKEHYGCTDKDVKNLMIRMMFLGHPESWVGETICEKSNNCDLEFVINFKRELLNIARNVWGACPEIVQIVSKKKKVSETQKLSSCLSIKLQNEEHHILMAMDESMKTQGRSFDVFVYDGGLVRKKDGESNLPKEILFKCQQHIKDTTQYDVKLVVKPMDTTLVFEREDANMIECGVIIDDVFAAKTFAKLMGDRMVYTDGCLYVFNDTQGLWTNDEVAIRQCVNNFESELKFHQVDMDSGKDKIYNYSGNERNINNMLKSVPAFCVVDKFFDMYGDTARGKLLFSDGIFDFDTNTFTEGFNPKIVFKDRIARQFPKERKEQFINIVNQVLFKDTFMDDEYVASDYLRLGIARALYGDYRAKKFYFCVGRSNAGKGVLTDALKATFQGFIGTYNAGSLAYNERNGADSAKQLSWVFSIKDKRMVISNEVSMNKPIDGNIIKMLASGGDEFEARRNHQDEIKCINRSTMFGFVNDIPTILPYDDAVGNRVRCIDYKCVFTENDITKDFERKADVSIKDRFKSDVDFQDALVHIMIDAYNEYKTKGHDVPECIREATKEWSGDAGSVEGILMKRYEITRDMNDFVPARELLNYLQKDEKMTMSDKKIGMELTALKLINKLKKVNGKGIQSWFGIRESVDGYLIHDEYN